jgi:hypothetical protein
MLALAVWSRTGGLDDLHLQARAARRIAGRARDDGEAEAGLDTLTHVRVRDAGSPFSRLMNE